MHFMLTCQLLDIALCFLLLSGMLTQYVSDTIDFSECLLKFVLKWMHLFLIVGMKLLLLKCQLARVFTDCHQMCNTTSVLEIHTLFLIQFFIQCVWHCSSECSNSVIKVYYVQVVGLITL